MKSKTGKCVKRAGRKAEKRAVRLEDYGNMPS